MSGRLSVVGTPIGNLEDITLRALRVLKEADVIACEDTRHSIKLLNHYEIKKHLFAYHQHNEESGSEKLIERLKNGEHVALISDAGMPVISDPGYVIIQRCIEEKIDVDVLPGANAALCALVLSGLPSREFTFLGFLGKQNKNLREGIEKIKEATATTIIYESPHRLLKTLTAMAEQIPNRVMSISREITKQYEETRQGTVLEQLDWFTAHPPKGEFVLVINGCDQNEGKAELVALPLEEHLAHYTQTGLSEKDAMKAVAQDRGISKRDVYGQLKIKE